MKLNKNNFLWGSEKVIEFFYSSDKNLLVKNFYKFLGKVDLTENLSFPKIPAGNFKKTFIRKV